MASEAKASRSKTSSSSDAAIRNSAKKQKQDSDVGEKHKHSSPEDEEDDEIEYSDSKQDELMEVFKSQKECYDIARQQSNKDEFMEVFKKYNPQSYLLCYRRISAYADKFFAPPPQQYESPFPRSNNVPFELTKWAEENVRPSENRPNRPMSIIIEGPSRIGKTIWARSLGPHNYLCGYLDLNDYSNDAWYNVIDNVQPRDLKHYKEFIGAEKNWVSKCKYGKRAQIKGGIPAIILCNPGPDSSYKEYLDKPKKEALRTWTLDNATFVFLTEPLY